MTLTHHTFDRKNPWTLTEAADIIRTSWAAVVRPSLSLTSSGAEAMVFELAGDEYIAAIYDGNGRVLRYGVLNRAGYELLIESVEPIDPDDLAYTAALAAAVDELAIFKGDAMSLLQLTMDDVAALQAA